MEGLRKMSNNHFQAILDGRPLPSVPETVALMPPELDEDDVLAIEDGAIVAPSRDDESVSRGRMPLPLTIAVPIVLPSIAVNSDLSPLRPSPPDPLLLFGRAHS